MSAGGPSLLAARWASAFLKVRDAFSALACRPSVVVGSGLAAVGSNALHRQRCAPLCNRTCYASFDATPLPVARKTGLRDAPCVCREPRLRDNALADRARATAAVFSARGRHASLLGNRAVPSASSFVIVAALSGRATILFSRALCIARHPPDTCCGFSRLYNPDK